MPAHVPDALLQLLAFSAKIANPRSTPTRSSAALSPLHSSFFWRAISFALVTEKLRQKGTNSSRNRANHNSSRCRNLRPRPALPHPGIHSRISHRAVDRSLPRGRVKHSRHLHDADGRTVLADRVSRKRRVSRNRFIAGGFVRSCPRRLDRKNLVAREVTRLRDRRRNPCRRRRRARHAARLEDDAFLRNAVAARNLSQRRAHLRAPASVALSRFSLDCLRVRRTRDRFFSAFRFRKEVSDQSIRWLGLRGRSRRRSLGSLRQEPHSLLQSCRLRLLAHQSQFLPDALRNSSSDFVSRVRVVPLGICPARFQPVIQFGQTSLLVYWVHMEFVYGRLSILPKGRCSIAAATAGLFIIFFAMLALSIGKTNWKRRTVRVSEPRPSVAATAEPV